MGNYLHAQSVKEIVTDFKGYWKTGDTAKLNKSHNLLSFKIKNTRYSTGVNDSILTAKGLTFTPGDFRALPFSTISAPNSNTYIGLGQLYDGVNNGASVPAPANNMAYYMSDGIHGLNIGTGIANFPAGFLKFSLNSIDTSTIGDNFPDILITQIAQPSTTKFDRLYFVDSAGNIIGDTIKIKTDTLPSNGLWYADFYTANSNPMVLTSGFTNTSRDLRLYAYDLSKFNISKANAHLAKKFIVRPNGDADMAFMAYNYNALVLTLPPTIIGQPLTQAVCKGNNTTLSVNALNAVSYAWKKNGTLISGATSSTYTITNAQPSNAANYTVVVTNAEGSVTSLPATVTVSVVSASSVVSFGSCSGYSNLAQISITAAGGTIPYFYKKDTFAYQSGQVFTCLQDGTYSITIKDKNNCTNTISVPVTIPLPVEYLEFKAEVADNNSIDINWSTALEINSSHYILERSFDGNNFNSIAQIPAAGNSNSIRNYYFNDNEVEKGFTYYYRLRQYDLDGSFRFSDIASAQTGKNLIQPILQPNPSTGIFSIKNTGSKKSVIIIITNILGQIVYTENAYKAGSDIDISSLENGLYFVRISTDGVASKTECLNLQIIH